MMQTMLAFIDTDNFVLLLPLLLTLVPAAGGFIAMTMLSGRAALVASCVTFLFQSALLVIGGLMLNGWDPGWLSLRRAEPLEWFPQWNITYDISLDAPALALVALVTLVTFCCSLFAAHARRVRPAPFQGLLWLTAAAMCGMFVARDLVVFYVYFELMLVPLLFLVGIWGGERRVQAAITMLVYTLVGSLPMLIGVIATGVHAGTFSLDVLSAQGVAGQLDLPWWAFLSFVVAFAIKAPLFPFHGWLPLTYRQAPPEVTAMLSGLVSKAAMFGFLVVVLPLFVDWMDGFWGTFLIWWCIASLLYGSLAAFRQPDARGVVAYSSMAQMGLILLGMSVYLGDGGTQGVAGGYMQAINHGLISAALFLLVGLIELRTGAGLLARLGGFAKGRPVLATVMLIVTLAALAVPGSNAFAGELLILAGAFQADWDHAWLYGTIAGTAIVLAAMYALRLLSAVMHTDGDDSAHGDTVETFGTDLRWRELSFVMPLVAAILFLSVWPNALKRPMNDRTPRQVEPVKQIEAAPDSHGKTASEDSH
jgi:NADH-quinone oxidoreductase subunit M